MKRSRSNSDCSTFPDQTVTSQPKSFRTENVIAASAEDLQNWLFENWDNDESSMKKYLNLIQERFFQRTADGEQVQGSPLKLVKKEYRASERESYWWELEIVLLAGKNIDSDNSSKTFSMFIRDVTDFHKELVSVESFKFSNYIFFLNNFFSLGPTVRLF